MKELKPQFRERLQQCLDALDRGLQHMAEQDGAAIGVQGVKALVQAADMLYKMHALEEGKPTDIVGRMQMTPNTLMRKLAEVDPFGMYGKKPDTDGSSVN